MENSLFSCEGLLLFRLCLLLRLSRSLELAQSLLLLLILLDPLSPFLELHALELGVVALVVPQLALEGGKFTDNLQARHRSVAQRAKLSRQIRVDNP